ncbi:MAG: flagellar hook protein FlgE, partial [Spirochaetaceae bacterium]|nr:flagellar hook protein FlgE [Spirochaetaceae bacterium]
MMRSLYSGVSGMQNHQTRLDVIGNNIANVNTTGFKRGRVNFQDMISQQLQSAARPTEEIGGVNPKEVGLGMTVASIDTVFTQGNLQSTGIGTDVAIQGNGFFILQEGEQTYYTRAGAFNVDQNGTLVNPATGFRVQGWQAREINGEPIVQTAATPENLVIPVGTKDPAHATVNVDFACNLNKNTPVVLPGATQADIARGTWSTEFNVYDSYGRVHNLAVSFQRVVDAAGVPVPNQWQVFTFVDPETGGSPNPLEWADQTNSAVGLTAETAAAGGGNTFIVTFDNNGTLLAATDLAGNVTNPEGDILLQVGFDVPESTADEGGAAYRQTFNLSLGTIGSQRNTITQSAAASSTKAFNQDGYTMGYLDNFKIDSTGQITGVYSNGTNRLLGQIALASFANQSGLEKAGD